jgi:hypothetical protein
MRYARYVSRHQQAVSPAFRAWLDQYVVASFSGWLHVDLVSQYGFPIPERPADALWYSPGTDEEAGDAPLDARQSEWWQEDADGVVLGIEQQSDSVQCCDHFTWYRIPLADIAQRMRTGKHRLH